MRLRAEARREPSPPGRALDRALGRPVAVPHPPGCSGTLSTEALLTDLLHEGRYIPAEAARMLNMSARTVRRWLAATPAHPPSGAPVIRHPDTPEGMVSFLDLVELRMVRELVRASGLNLRTVRKNLQEAARLLGVDHPLARRRLLRQEKHLFVGLSDGPDAPFVVLGTNGQLALEQLLHERAEVLDFNEDDLAIRWWPLGRERPVVVDPAVGFGNPTIAGTRIYTSTLVSMVRAEEGDYEKVGRLYHLAPDVVRTAVEYEGLLAA